MKGTIVQDKYKWTPMKIFFTATAAILAIIAIFVFVVSSFIGMKIDEVKESVVTVKDSVVTIVEKAPEATESAKGFIKNMDEAITSSKVYKELTD